MTNHKKFSKVDLIQLFGRATLVCGLLIAGLMYWLAPKAGSPHPAVVNSVSGEPSAAHERRQVTPTGTPGVGTMPIEQIRVGDRVLAHNPEVGDAERRGWAEPDWGNWLHLSLEMPLPTEGESDAEPKILSIEILRPESWLRGQIGYVVDIPGVASTTEPTAPAAGLPATVAASPVSRSRDAGGSDAVAAGEGSFPLAASSQTTLASHSPNPPLTSSQFPAVPLSPLRPIYRDVAITSAVLATEGIDLIGLTVDMDLPEMGAFGTAVLTDIRPCPPVGSGDGQPVTATFSHPPSTAVLNVVFAGESEPIGVTDNHQFWSVDDEQFKPIGEMAIGEQVQTYQGETKRIAAKLPRPGPQTVYNLEVYGEHVYFVGEQGLLAHNMCQAPNPGGGLDAWLAAGQQGGLRRNIAAWRLNNFRNNSTRYYGVFSDDAAARLAAGGEPWPTGMSRANLGEGLYVWGTRADAVSYLQLRQVNPAFDAAARGTRIRSLRVGNRDLNRFSRLDLRNVDDATFQRFIDNPTAYADNFSPHGFEYVIYPRAAGTEHFFDRSVFQYFVMRP